jgi:hypothetical protein
MQIQGIAPPCRDIQKNCDVPGPVAGETYTQTELIEVNRVSVETARQQAWIALAGFARENTSGHYDPCGNATITGDPVVIYDINGMKQYYRFSAGNGNTCYSILVKANKLLGVPLFVIQSGDILDNMAPQIAIAEKRAQADHPEYRVVLSRVVFYRDFQEGIQVVMENPATKAGIQPVIDLRTLSDVTQDAASLFPLVSEKEYASRMGTCQHLLSDWEVENTTIRESVSP